MKIYHYKQSGEYSSDGVAQPSPLDDTFLIPAQATIIKPPNPIDGFARSFKNDKWVQVVDNRNITKYIGMDKVVFDLGDEITPEMTNEPPPPPPPTQSQLIVSIRQQYDKAIQAVCTANLLNDINSARNLATLTASPLQAIAAKISAWELGQQATFITLLSEAEKGIITLDEFTFDDKFIVFEQTTMGSWI